MKLECHRFRVEDREEGDQRVGEDRFRRDGQLLHKIMFQWILFLKDLREPRCRDCGVSVSMTNGA